MPPWARWGWLVTTLALGAVVIGSAWSNYHSVRGAAGDLIRGQAQIFRDVVIATNRPGSDGRRADFDSLVTAQRDAGQLLLERLAADPGAHRKAHRVVEEATRLEALTVSWTSRGPGLWTAGAGQAPARSLRVRRRAGAHARARHGSGPKVRSLGLES